MPAPAIFADLKMRSTGPCVSFSIMIKNRQQFWHNLSQSQEFWLALAIGNSRLHWAGFIGTTLQLSWHTPHLSSAIISQLIDHNFSVEIWLKFLPDLTEIPAFVTNLNQNQAPSLCIASVVPAQLELWQNYPFAYVLQLSDIPLKGMYPTLGMDRALAVWGAGIEGSWPVLVIDAGTALTFTGVGADQCLVGGAILPGLRLQLQALSQQTAALPFVDTQGEIVPRWATNTKQAIQSGILYTIVAGLRDFTENWCEDFPDSQVVLTGGDAQILFTYLHNLMPEFARRLQVKADLIFWGMCWTIWQEISYKS